MLLGLTIYITIYVMYVVYTEMKVCNFAYGVGLALGRHVDRFGVVNNFLSTIILYYLSVKAKTDSATRRTLSSK